MPDMKVPLWLYMDGDGDAGAPVQPTPAPSPAATPMMDMLEQYAPPTTPVTLPDVPGYQQRDEQIGGAVEQMAQQGYPDWLAAGLGTAMAMPNEYMRSTWDAMSMLPAGAMAGVVRKVKVPKDVQKKFGLKSPWLEIDTKSSSGALIRENSKMKHMAETEQDLAGGKVGNTTKEPGRSEHNPGGSCIGCGTRIGECGNPKSPSCYAQHGLQKMADAKAVREKKPGPSTLHGLRLQDLNAFKQDMADELRKTKYSYLRLNDKGDIASQDELDAWVDIAKEFPQTVFGVYTKSHNLDWSEWDKLHNTGRISSTGSKWDDLIDPNVAPPTFHPKKGEKFTPQPGDINNTDSDWPAMKAIVESKQTGSPMPTRVILEPHGAGAKNMGEKSAPKQGGKRKTDPEK